ncbi:MAG: hypothetical protein Q9213_003267 [Squamulea squamosa]
MPAFAGFFNYYLPMLRSFGSFFSSRVKGFSILKIPSRPSSSESSSKKLATKDIHMTLGSRVDGQGHFLNPTSVFANEEDWLRLGQAAHNPPNLARKPSGTRREWHEGMAELKRQSLTSHPPMTRMKPAAQTQTRSLAVHDEEMVTPVWESNDPHGRSDLQDIACNGLSLNRFPATSPRTTIPDNDFSPQKNHSAHMLGIDRMSWRISDSITLNVVICNWTPDPATMLSVLAAAAQTVGKKPADAILTQKFVQKSNNRYNTLLFEVSPGFIRPYQLTWGDVGEVLGENGLRRFFEVERYWHTVYFDIVHSVRGIVGEGALRRWWQLEGFGEV